MTMFHSMAVLFASSLIPILSWGSILPNDVDLCQGQNCTEKMLSIQKAYTENKHFAIQAGDVGLYSGSCYHLGQSVDSQHEHHGLALFETQADNVIGYQGLFSFFANTNPYAGMDAAAARTRLSHSGSRPYAVELVPGGGQLKIAFGEDGEINYWFHTTDNGAELYLLSEWKLKNGQQLSFCRFNRHETN